MDMKDSPTSLRNLLANALPARAHLPILVGTDFMPLVWVDGRLSPEATLLQARLFTLSTYLGQFSESGLEQVYGKIDVRWIYAYGRANAFFLHIIVDAPTLSTPTAVPALRAEFAVRFELGDVTARLLRTIAECRRLLLHFDAEPEWVQHLPPPQDNERARDMGERGLALVRSGLPLLFRPEVMARLAGQIDLWERIFEQRGG
jgi:hypothetical protein